MQFEQELRDPLSATQRMSALSHLSDLTLRHACIVTFYMDNVLTMLVDTPQQTGPLQAPLERDPLLVEPPPFLRSLM